MASDEPRRVELTEQAADLLHKLTGQHGPLMFHQSGGCCDGSSPMCFPDGEPRRPGPRAFTHGMWYSPARLAGSLPPRNRRSG